MATRPTPPSRQPRSSSPSRCGSSSSSSPSSSSSSPSPPRTEGNAKWGPVARRELAWLAGAVLLGIAIRVAYVLITQGHHPVNDELEYNREGLFIEQGKFFWSTAPYGI